MSAAPVVLDWYGCDLGSGLIMEELRAVSASEPLGRKLGTSTTGSCTIALAGAPPSWLAATTPGRTMLVPVDRFTGQPITAGIVLTRGRGSASTATLGMASPEAYFDRRYTGSFAAVGADQAAIITGTGAALAVDAPCFTFDAPAIGVTQDYAVDDGDDRTILSVWQELMAASGGPEWTVDVAWNASKTGFVLPVRVRAANGVGTVTASPQAVFDMPGCITNYTLTESYEDGKGATSVIAYGDGEGDGRLHSDTHTADALIAAGYVLWEYRYTPAAASTDPVALNALAAGSLAAMAAGSSVWDITATASRAPRLGPDFGLGDSVTVQIARSPGHPDGATTTARCWAWQLDPGADTVQPILVEDSDARPPRPAAARRQDPRHPGRQAGTPGARTAGRQAREQRRHRRRRHHHHRRPHPDRGRRRPRRTGRRRVAPGLRRQRQPHQLRRRTEQPDLQPERLAERRIHRHVPRQPPGRPRQRSVLRPQPGRPARCTRQRRRDARPVPEGRHQHRCRPR